MESIIVLFPALILYGVICIIYSIFLLAIGLLFLASGLLPIALPVMLVICIVKFFMDRDDV